MEEYNIWELGDNINVKIGKEFYNSLRKAIKEEHISLPKFYERFKDKFSVTFSVFKDRLKPNYKNFVDLEIYITLCKILDINLQELQKNIIAYKARRGCNYIENPILPVKITPIFDMLIAHHIGDGNVIAPKKKCRRPYFSYRQFDQNYKLLYFKKIEGIFGTLRYKNEYYKDSKNTKVYFPTVCSDLVFNLYNLNIKSFLSEAARIPKQIFEKNWKHRLAFLIGIIIDEGHVDSTLIVIRMKNQEFIKDLYELCQSLDYRTSIIVENNGYATLNILSQTLSKFYKDYLILLYEFSVVDLGYKGTKIKEFIQRLNKPKIYRPGNKQNILELLSKDTLTVNELATKLNMTRQGARYLIHELEKEDKVEVKNIVKFANRKYGVK